MKYNKIIQGDTLKVLKTLPDEIINCCVTSPPYWSLRDYGVEGQLGLEKTFEEYINKLCNIFDEVKRVLRKDGTIWVNLGDSYNGNKTGNTNGTYKNRIDKSKSWANSDSFKKAEQDIPAKSLCLIPQRFAIEMVNRGWILRNTIIWHKPNCMPSSAKDRFTVDFEYLYFFTKSKKYWFEQQLEPHKEVSIKARNSKLNQTTNIGASRSAVNVQMGNESRGNRFIPEGGKNKRAVWTITTKPFKEAHFATFPEDLIATPIKAGCPRYVCKKCGKAREKIFETNNPKGISGRAGTPMVSKGIVDTFDGKQIIEPGHSSTVYSSAVYKGLTNCGCNAGFEPGIVLDPFMGAGTTAKVALKQGKKYLGIELKQEYIDMANKRIKAIPLKLFK